MRIFISSTYKDLVEYRHAVADALERLGLQFERMETFGARPDDATRACLREVEESDLFLGIYAHRYGYIPKDSEISITEAEFNHAFNNRRPTFCYFLDDTYSWPEVLVEDEPGKNLLKKFRARVEAVVVRDLFTTPDVLASRVASAIGRYLIADPRRHGAPNAAQFALLTLADASTAVFVDVMRLVCVAASDLARAANQSRYSEFVDMADQHLSDFRVQITRLAADTDLDTITKCSAAELGLTSAIVRLRRGPTIDRTWCEFVVVMRDLAERVNALADTVSRDYYTERIRQVESVTKKLEEQEDPSALANRADHFVSVRFAAQSAVIVRMREAGGFALATVRDDIDRRLAIPYFAIDLQLLRRAASSL